ncbi:MAG TPA: DUF1800 domain-containing protein [Blastocatellia bacterium]|nr:DUF1800 domain-containing protein [Blastocatellia bacterium]
MATISYDEAAHLLRRMGFGGPPDEIDGLVARGREGAVDYLINYSQIDNKPLEDILAASFDFTDVRDNRRVNQGEIRRLWFTRMIHTRRQFEEKMTLFWHNHFATALSKVQDILMFNQNVMLRANALERFDTLLKKVAEDPAMIVWLDANTNVLGSPNENFARELQELFTMGITDVVTGEANYTEDDVKEIARAFTGYNFRVNRNGTTIDNLFQFFINAARHDNTAKTVYGQTANFTGDDIITIIANRRATGRYLVKKLFDFFVYPITSSSADRQTVDKFSNIYVSSNHSMKELVRAIFVSDEFYSDRARFALVKQPVEFIVGAIRMLGGQYVPGRNAGDRPDVSNIPAAFSRNMGEDIYNPPDVAGWELNLGWVNTAAMLERFNYTNQLLTTRRTDRPGIFITNDQLKKYTKSSSKKTVKKFLSVLGPLDTGNSVVKTLKNYLETDDNGNAVGYTNNDATVDKKIRGLVHQIMCLPEFQLN